jgi:hypothetical protein
MCSTNRRDLPTSPLSLCSGGWIADYGVHYEIICINSGIGSHTLCFFSLNTVSVHQWFSTGLFTSVHSISLTCTQIHSLPTKTNGTKVDTMLRMQKGHQTLVSGPTQLLRPWQQLVDCCVASGSSLVNLQQRVAIIGSPPLLDVSWRTQGT